MRVCVTAFFGALCLLVGSGSGYIDVNRPDTLGATCARAQSITVIRVVKVRQGEGRAAVTYRTVKDLKGELPRASFRQVFGKAHEDDELKALLA